MTQIPHSRPLPSPPPQDNFPADPPSDVSMAPLFSLPFIKKKKTSSIMSDQSGATGQQLSSPSKSLHDAGYIVDGFDQEPTTSEPTAEIAILGLTGSGKTTFVNLLLNSDRKMSVGKGLRSCTVEVQEALIEIDGRRVILIDTPGFDDSARSDADVLTLIAKYLADRYNAGRKLAGVIYLHRISDVRMNGVAQRTFRMFRKLCGKETLCNVAIVTNMWSEVSKEVGEARERELRNGRRFFQPAVERDAVILRHSNTAESARNIVRDLLRRREPRPLRIQREMVDDKKGIPETDAGEELGRALAEQINKHRKNLAAVEREIQGGFTPLLMSESDEETRQELEIEKDKLQFEIERAQEEELRMAVAMIDLVHAQGGLEARLNQELPPTPVTPRAEERTQAEENPRAVDRSRIEENTPRTTKTTPNATTPAVPLRRPTRSTTMPPPAALHLDQQIQKAVAVANGEIKSNPPTLPSRVSQSKPGVQAPDNVGSPSSLERSAALRQSMMSSNRPGKSVEEPKEKENASSPVTPSGLASKAITSSAFAADFPVLQNDNGVKWTHASTAANAHSVVVNETVYAHSYYVADSRYPQVAKRTESQLPSAGRTGKFLQMISDPHYRAKVEKSAFIAVLGATGSGKSTFINLISKASLGVGNTLKSCTSKVQEAPTIQINNQMVTLVDTPGFDDTTRSDASVLKMIADFFCRLYRDGMSVTGIIYVHRISDIRMTGAALRNLRMFIQLCGPDALRNVAVMTNMWSKVRPEVGQSREKELFADAKFFGPVIKAGARQFRHDDSLESSLRIVSSLLSNRPVLLQIQREMVLERKAVAKTAAGRELNRELAEQLYRHRVQMTALQKEIKDAIQQKDEETRQELESERSKLMVEYTRAQNDARELSQFVESDLRKTSDNLAKAEAMVSR
ncbi:unnamed protein product [Mycena citricolor]|uniref:G domain-containing protein n=1 Tax=Mycena citricolor TaxID=2018698 RepID=A0AAD2JYY2_9AGAR|nr:unnamed protein product [Mycena citricolor]